jgi:hypothetical protein
MRQADLPQPALHRWRMSRRQIVQPLDREPRRRRAPGPVTIRFVCPTCGADHPAHAHELDPVARRAERERLQRRWRIAAERDPGRW